MTKEDIGDEFQTYMLVVAHPDDSEFSSAGTVARLKDAGKRVVLIQVTSGDKGSDDPEMTPQRLAATREAEQREAARILGASDVIFMRCPDGELEPNLELRREIVRIIRRLKPDVVVCQDPTVRWVDTQYINHPDHRAAGEATLAAVFPAARDRMNFPELLAEGLEPHKVREIYLAGAQTPDVALFFLKTAQPDLLKNAPGGEQYLTKDQAQLARGKTVFAETCALRSMAATLAPRRRSMSCSA